MTHSLLLAAILLFAGGTVFAWSFHLMWRRRSEMERRLNLAGDVQRKTLETEAPAVSPAANGKKRRGYAERFFTFGAGYSWGMHASTPLLIAAAILSAGAVWFGSTQGAGLPLWAAAPASAVAAFLGPRAILVRQRQRTLQQFTDHFPDAVETVARMLRAGMPITFAIQAAGKEVPPPVSDVFSMLAGQISIGIPVDEALDMASKLVTQADFRFFTVAAMIQHSTGGNLVSTLEELSQVMRKRQSTRLKAQAISAEIRFSAYVLGGLPFVVLGGLLLIDPGYLAPLFDDPRGRMILSMAGGGVLLALITMRQMIRGTANE